MNPTPTLKGKEAEKFRKREIANRKKLANKKEVAKAIRTFCRILAKCDKDLDKMAKDFLKNS
jgi:hypothetical protein